jgi:hypothetical protein
MVQQIAKMNLIAIEFAGFELIATFSERTVTSSMEMAEYENISTLEADKWLLSLIKASEQ